MILEIKFHISKIEMHTFAFSCKNSIGIHSLTKTKRGIFVYMMIANKIALVLSIIGGINWGLVGLFSFDLVAWIAGGSTMLLARIIYIVIALSSIWCISLLFGDAEGIESKV